MSTIQARFEQKGYTIIQNLELFTETPKLTKWKFKTWLS